MQIQIHAAGDRQLTVTGMQRLTGHVNRGQRRGTHGVDGHARAIKIEKVRNPIRYRPKRSARLQRFTGFPQRRPMQTEAGLGDTGKHADAAAVTLGQIVTRQRCVFQRRVAGFDKQPLLRVNALRLARRNPEKQRIEVRKALQEATPFGVTFTLCNRKFVIWFKKAIERPSFGRNFADAVATCLQILPIVVQGRCLWIATADADDRDWLLRSHPRLRLYLGYRTGHMVGVKVVGQRRQCPVFIEQRLRQRAKAFFELLIQACDHDRVDAVTLQRFVGVDLRQWKLGAGGEQRFQCCQCVLRRYRRDGDLPTRCCGE